VHTEPPACSHACHDETRQAFGHDVLNIGRKHVLGDIVAYRFE
jgi:hypothetical protein